MASDGGGPRETRDARARTRPIDEPERVDEETAEAREFVRRRPDERCG